MILDTFFTSRLMSRNGSKVFDLASHWRHVTATTDPLTAHNVLIYVIFTKGKKDEVSNYRPVRLTCIVCKILESIIRDKIMKHFAKN